MKVIRVLLAAVFLIAGVLLSARLAPGRAVAGQPARAGLLSAIPDYTTELSTIGSQGQHSSNPGMVRVLEPQADANLLAAVDAAVRLPLMPEDEPVFLPLIVR